MNSCSNHHWRWIKWLNCRSGIRENGYIPLILEAADAGGRLKTDIINGFQLDHGFQVLLSKNLAAKVLNYDKLDLQYLSQVLTFY